MENHKYLIWSAVGVLAGGTLLWYLSRDDEPTVRISAHQVKVIQKILDEVALEAHCSHIRIYHEIQKKHEQSIQVTPQDLAKWQK